MNRKAANLVFTEITGILCRPTKKVSDTKRVPLPLSKLRFSLFCCYKTVQRKTGEAEWTMWAESETLEFWQWMKQAHRQTTTGWRRSAWLELDMKMEKWLHYTLTLQSTGVATFFVAVSCSESSTRRTSLKHTQCTDTETHQRYKLTAYFTWIVALAGAATRIICHKKSFLSWQKICLSWRKFCHDKIMFVATHICRKNFFCCDKSFVMTSINLSRQNTSFISTKYASHDKTFVKKSTWEKFP